jgi:hypothetical protein
MIVSTIYKNKIMDTGNICLKVVRSDGSIRQSYVQKIDSFVINCWDKYYFGIHTGFGDRLSWDAGGGINAYNGIIVGSGDTPVEYTDTELDIQILHGSITNRLIANAPSITYVSSENVIISRVFENVNTVAGIEVKECGIRVGNGDLTSSTGGLLIIRDVLDTPITVAETELLTVEYDITFTDFFDTNNRKLFINHLIARDNDNMVLINQSGTTIEGAFGSGNNALSFVTETMTNSRGIVVGTNITPTSGSAIALFDPIAHGTGSGELLYKTCFNTSTVIGTDGSSNYSEWYIIRYFENKSGSSINIGEVGIVSNATINSTNYVYLFQRANFDDPIEVADNTSAAILWYFSYVF